MSAKAAIEKMLAAIAEFEATLESAKYELGETRLVFENDPESETLLEAHRLGVNDTNVTIEIGPADFPGAEWYRAYQEAARAGDDERVGDLLRRGAAAVTGA
jgi:hypothetical protein